jgi:hypothetical protein
MMRAVTLLLVMTLVVCLIVNYLELLIKLF